MAEQKIVDYIEKVTSKGYTLDQAKKKLSESEYPEKKIDEAISHVKKKKMLKTSEIVFGIIILVALLSVVSDKLLIERSLVEEPKPVSDEDILNLAITGKDSTVCEQLTDPTKKRICERMVSSLNGAVPESSPDEETLKQATATGNASGCDNIEDDVKRKICERMAAPPQKQQGTTPEPETIQEPETFQDDTSILIQAQQTHDSSLCDQINDTLQKNICIRMSS